MRPGMKPVHIRTADPENHHSEISRLLLKSFKPSGSQGVQGCRQGALGKSGDNFVF